MKNVLLFLIVSLGFSVPLGRQALHAAQFGVNKTNDVIANHSLRGAIRAANNAGGKNIIVLNRKPSFESDGTPKVWTVRLSLAGANEDKARAGDLDVTRGKLTIISPHTNVVIDASELGDRVFQVFPKAQLTLQNLTITGGHTPENDSWFGHPSHGGAIHNAGSLILINCRIIGNSAGKGRAYMGNGGGDSGGDAGGIFNIGTLTMQNCLIAENTAGDGEDGASGGNGGGINNSGTCMLTNCLFVNNASGDGGVPAGNFSGFAGSGGHGGAIFNIGTTVMIGCVVTNNSSGHGQNGASGGSGMAGSIPGAPGGNGGDGAGIFNSGTLNVRNSIVTGNLCGNGGAGGRGVGFQGGAGGAGGNGGGIFSAGTAILDVSTVSGNSCGNGGIGGTGYPQGGDGGYGGYGGGFCSLGPLNLTTVTVTNNNCGAGGNGGIGVRFFARATVGGNGGEGGSGGGVFHIATNTPAVLEDVLISHNLAGGGGAGGPADPVEAGATVGAPGASGLEPDFFGDFVQ